MSNKNKKTTSAQHTPSQPLRLPPTRRGAKPAQTEPASPVALAPDADAEPPSAAPTDVAPPSDVPSDIVADVPMADLPPTPAGAIVEAPARRRRTVKELTPEQAKARAAALERQLARLNAVANGEVAPTTARPHRSIRAMQELALTCRNLQRAVDLFAGNALDEILQDEQAYRDAAETETGEMRLRVESERQTALALARDLVARGVALWIKDKASRDAAGMSDRFVKLGLVPDGPGFKLVEQPAPEAEVRAAAE